MVATLNECGDLLGHQTGPPLVRLCGLLFPKKRLAEMLLSPQLVYWHTAIVVSKTVSSVSGE